MSQRVTRAARIAVDAVLLVGVFIVFVTHEGNITTHSILGLLLLIPVVIHLRSNLGALLTGVREWARREDHTRTVVNVGVATMLVLATVTGILVWVDVPGLGGPHNITSIALMLTVIAHLVVNRRRLKALLSRAGSRSAVPAPE